MLELVSVIVPVYNIELYIERCIRSILAQTYDNLELILVNDGSVDRSLSICEKYVLLDSRIKIINKKNGGLSSARNAGMSVAAGEWILFVDGDDWIDKECVEKCLEFVQKETDIIMFPYKREFLLNSKNVEIFEEEYRKFNKKEIEEYLVRRLVGPIENELLKPNRIEDLNTVWNKLYRREIIKKIEFVDTKEIGTEDLWFNINAFSNAKEIIFTKTVYYHYNKINDNALTRTYNDKLFKGWIRLYSLIEAYIETNYENDIYIKALNNRKIINLLALTRNVVSSTLSYKEKRKELKKILSASQYSKAFNEFDFSRLNIIWKIYYKACKNKNITLICLMMYVAERLKQYS